MENLTEYELVVVLTPEASEDDAVAAVDRVEGFIADHGGAVSVRENWGVKQLAYPIQNFQEGNYFLVRFELHSKDTRELNGALHGAQDVLRHLVTIADGPRPAAAEEKAEKPQEAAVESTAADQPAAAEKAEKPQEAAVESTAADQPAAAEKAEAPQSSEAEARPSGEAEGAALEPQ